ncbi:MAG: tetratricopeptide repeat protein, partial [Chloroflexi bacterium]|nr:tetratricopeptide repeat protein [Chloroflexota bacterium]
QAQDLGNLGIVYRQQGKLKEAEASHQKALDIHTRIGNTL